MLSFIFAEDNKHHIGYHNQLPWHLPADLKHFKSLTNNHYIIMGKNTFLSLPKLLPNRIHVVLTHDLHLTKQYISNDKVIIINTQYGLFQWIKRHNNDELFVIGGYHLFNLLKDQAQILYQTKIDYNFDKADTVMPDIDYSQYKLIDNQSFTANNKNKYNYSFNTYKRI